MYVLKNLKRLDKLPDKLREKVFEKIFSAAEIAKLSQEEYKQYIVSLNAYRDLKNSIDTAREEGKAEKSIEVALKAVKMGLSIEDASKLSDLTIKEIEKLIKNQMIKT
jgi:hypothetical protein